MYCACAMPEPAKMTSTATAMRPGVITRSCSSPPTARQRFGAMSVDATRGRAPRVTSRSYRAASEAIHDHFVGSRHLVALETHPEDRLQQVASRRHVGKPGRKDDHVIGALFADEAKDALLALAAVRDDLGRHQAHQVDDRTTRNEGDGADVVERQAPVTRNVLGDPVA